jgi:nitrogen fixation-related uncharacterized protein
MNCPSCLTGALGPAWIAAFSICILFFITGGLALLWANRSGHMANLEQSKFKMLNDDD